MIQIYDVCTFNGESELLEMRLNILNPVVDQFIVVEFPVTFSGKKKTLKYPPDLRKFTKFFKKLSYFAIPESVYAQYSSLAETSPNVPKGGPAHWKREFCQKESIKWTLANLQDSDTVMIGDVDEVVSPEHYTTNFLGVSKFKLRVYTYWLNNRSSEQFWGPIRAHWSDIKNECLNHTRTNAAKTQEESGWHFTSMKSYLDAGKLTDSYTQDSYASESVLNNLQRNIRENRDFLGRDFAYRTDESEWPDYLTKNRKKYEHMCT